MLRRSEIWLRMLALSLFLAAVFFYSWNSDDAYHSYIMARHLVEGKGLVYNTGYRVSASTCPLLTLVEAFVFLFTDSADVCGLLIGLLFSGAAAWVLFFRLCPSLMSVFCMLGLMVSSRCFLSFTTSGLENPLLFFFGALFFDIYHRDENLSRRQLFALALLVSLLAMARTDSVLIFIPMAVWAYLVLTKVPFPVRVMLGVVGLLPFALWTLFSLLYYGFPFPNTYYAKLYTGIPFADYVTSGLWYYPTSWLIDPMLMLVPALFVAMAIKDRCRFLIPLFIGLSVYCLYVVSIGGDFMAGRHLTQQYFLSLCGIAYMLRCYGVASESTQQKEGNAVWQAMSIMVVLVVVGSLWNGFVAPVVNKRWATLDTAYETRRSALDERKFYLTETSDIPMYKAAWKYLKDGVATTFRDECRKASILKAHANGELGVCAADGVFGGRDVFAASNLDMYLSDIIALQDPLLARLKVNRACKWRIGHAEREVPAGYHDTITSGENKIENRYLHAYYDKLLLVMKGPLLDGDRLRTIWALNRGEYDNLLEEYEKTARGSEKLVFAIKALLEELDGDKALRLLDQCLASADGIKLSGLAHYYRGCVFEDIKNDLAVAEEEYGIALHGEWPIGLVPCADRLARLKAIKGDLSGAISLWEKAAKLDPDNDSVQHNLAVARRNAEESDK